MFENKKVLILGANSDIAKNIAYILYIKNYKLTLISRDIDSLKSSLTNLKINIEYIEFIKMDIKDTENFKLYYENLNETHDIIISAVGELSNSNLSTQPNILEDMINTNYIYPAKCLEIISEIFVKKNSSKEKIILGISSLAGERGRAINYHYGSAKSAFTVFLSGLRQKLSNYNITVITVLLGYVKTKMTKNLKSSSFLVSEPDKIAKDIIKCIEKKKVVFTPLKWKIIILIIKLIPENIFKKLNF
mgnify:CR=1 FL=1